MKVSALAPFFVIKISKKEQKDRREKIGSLYLAPGHTFMTREMQAGEIVSIGTDAHDTFPEAEIGDTLITHHFVTGKEGENTDEGKFHILSDEKYNYYTVTCCSFNGRGNETYGVFKNGEIIPHPDFIFLEDDAPIERLSPEQLHREGMQQKGSLFLFNKWKETREEKTKKMQELKFQAQELSRTTKKDIFGNDIMPDEVKVAVENIEQEIKNLGRDSQKKEYLPYKVAWANQLLSEELEEDIKNGDIVYGRSDAANTKIEFNGVSYRVIKINYIAGSEKWVKSSFSKFKSLSKELV